jgi:peptidoglycan hydrolase-like protein with peptidoglycan-binding domain
MKTVMLVVVGAILLASPAAYAQYPGEVSPFGPSTSDVIANMKFTFQVCAPHPVVQEAQVALKEQGYYTGPVDGVLSPAVKTAIWNFQRAHGLTRTACLDRITIAALGLGGDTAYASPPSFSGPAMQPVEVQAP